MKKYFSSMKYAFYLALGFLLSQLLNIWVYETKGGKVLLTWFNQFKLTIYGPSIKFTFYLCLIMAIIIFFFLSLLFYKLKFFSIRKILYTGIYVSIFLCLISQIVFSSVIRLAYEISFCLIIFLSVIISRVFVSLSPTDPEQISTANRELWDLLKILTPICIGFPVIIGGSGIIEAFYKEEQGFYRSQIYRHLALAFYFEAGAFYFLIFPLVKKILSTHKK